MFQHCTGCPADRRFSCAHQGCHSILAQLRSFTFGKPAPDALAIEVKRLDVENNDILIVRTAEKLSPEKADAFHDRVLALARRHGVRDVSCVVLDGCTDLTIERPSTAMAHQRPRAQPQPMGQP